MHRHMIFFFTILNRNHISFHLFSIHFQISNAFFHIVRVLHIEVVSGTAEAAGEGEVTESFRNARINGESVIGWLYAKDCLREIDKGPGCCSCEPAVFCFAVAAASRPAIIWE